MTAMILTIFMWWSGEVIFQMANRFVINDSKYRRSADRKTNEC